MTFSENGERGLRCVMPFEALPGEVRLLRSAVRSTLGQWGAQQAVDEAELVVTELATNVIKHVGEGAPATLVLETSGDRLRMELHDMSPVLPSTEIGRPDACDAECGRGLHLLASMSTAWGAVPMGRGKAVWCELALVVDAVCARAGRAAAMLETYRGLVGARGSVAAVRSRVNQEAAVTLIADLLVWFALQGSDPDDALARAQQLYDAGEAAA
ncbi:ATP-binding protein [Streptomyces sp. NPDC059071]|uniref:ATP-binding protein n=1 Tax=unclassified Streptomyces TaxID=2593676 RepID=UPI003656E491